MKKGIWPARAKREGCELQAEERGAPADGARDLQSEDSGAPADGACESQSEDSSASADGESEPQGQDQGEKAGEHRQKPPRPLTARQMLVRLLAKIAAIVVVVILVLTFVLGLDVHYGNNMFPAVRDGDLLLTFRLQEPHINDVVLYRHDGQTCVGRVIALEGHEVDISDEGQLKVNGIIPAEEVFYPTFRDESASVKYPYSVEGGKVFILNDFREDVNDSRCFGAIDESDVMGSMLLVIRRRGF